MRFIHTADYHLGARPDKDRPWGPARADAVRRSLAEMIGICNEKQADLLLIAGDLFHRPPAEAELKELDYLFSRLKLTKVVLIAGNHDFVRPGCSYTEHRFPENVFFLSSPKLTVLPFPQWNLDIYGFSYDAEKRTDDPLADLVLPQDGRRHILLMHGGDAEHVPFRLSDLKAMGWDYAALGHIHRPSVSADGRIAMPGSPEALDRSETGPHGYFLGEISAQKFSLSWQTFSHFEYSDLKINVTPEMTQASLEALLARRLKPDYTEICRVILSGRRDPAMSFDCAALERLGPVSEVLDETQPDYPWELLAQRPAHDILSRTILALKPEEKDPEASLKQEALYFAMDALLHSARQGGKEALR